MTTPLIDGPIVSQTAPTSFSLPQAYSDAGYCRKQSARDESAPLERRMQAARQLLEA
jgi:hypothetical protein